MSTSSTLGSQYLDALRILCDRLRNATFPWVITGSLGFALQGLPVEPHDIDVQTTATGAYEIERRCAEFVARPIAFSSAERIQSHYGALIIAGLTVEIMGGIQKRLPDGSWGAPTDLPRHHRFVISDGERVPILSLAYEADAYRTLGRAEIADMLDRWLRDHPE